MNRIILATQNRHKIEELQAVLPEGWRVRTADDEGIRGELPEDGRTLEANATQKALFLWKRSQVPSLADDSGLEVEALAGAPGVDSAMYAGPERSDSANRIKLLEQLEGARDRKARFRTVLAWATLDGVQLFEGVVHGQITRHERGTNGFGYDSVFVPDDGDGRTFAEMSPAEKVALSHRSRAVQAWLRALEKS